MNWLCIPVRRTSHSLPAVAELRRRVRCRVIRFINLITFTMENSATVSVGSLTNLEPVGCRLNFRKRFRLTASNGLVTGRANTPTGWLLVIASKVRPMETPGRRLPVPMTGCPSSPPVLLRNRSICLTISRKLKQLKRDIFWSNSRPLNSNKRDSRKLPRRMRGSIPNPVRRIGCIVVSRWRNAKK